MTKEQRLELLKQIEKQIYVPSSKATLQDELKSVAILSIIDEEIERLEQKPCEDSISRQAVLDGIDTYINKAQSTGTQDDFYSFAVLVVKELPSVTPQEPFMNKPCIAHQVCHEDKVKVLDKIRAEIDEQYDKVHPYNLSCAEGLEMALGIIDKYNAESEKKEEISKDDARKIVHDTLLDFFDDSETFNDKDKLLLKINKAICNNIMGY